MRPRVAVAVVLAVVALMQAAEVEASVCSRGHSGDELPYPPVLTSSNGLLDVTLTLFSETDNTGFTRYCYVNTHGQSPTLRLGPGDTLRIKLENAVGMSSPYGNSYTMVSCGSMTYNSSATNLHFHGFSLTPNCPGDDIPHISVKPGQTFTYEMVIPSSHPGGLMWYHPHVYGTTQTEVDGGASGAIVINGLENYDPRVGGLPERQLIVRGTPLGTSFWPWNLHVNYVPVGRGQNAIPATMTVKPGQRQLWRLLNAASGATVILRLEYDGVPQTFQVVAIDGVAQTLSLTKLSFPSGSRYEVIVTTPSSSVRSAHLIGYRYDGVSLGFFQPTTTLVQIRTSSSASDGMSYMPVQTETKSNYFPSATPVRSRRLYFFETYEDPQNPYGELSYYMTEVGKTPTKFHAGITPAITVKIGTVEDWTIENYSPELHIFHMHQVHFKVMRVSGLPQSMVGQLRDVIDVPVGSTVTIRLDFTNPEIEGVGMYHCHVLEHEDAGMMQEVLFSRTDPESAPKPATSRANAAGGSVDGRNEQSNRTERGGRIPNAQCGKCHEVARSAGIAVVPSIFYSNTRHVTHVTAHAKQRSVES